MGNNVILIVIDALRARNLSCYGYPEKTSPNIDKLAKEGVLFNNAYSNINTTDPSLTTIYTGKFPKTHGLVRHGTSVQEGDIEKISSQVFLSELLQKEGFSTLAIDWLGRWHKRGFDYYSGVESSSPLAKLRKMIFNKKKYINLLPTKIFSFLLRIIPEKFENATSVTNKAIDAIKKNSDGNFFLFVHYWDTHSPYGPPVKKRGGTYTGIPVKIKNKKRREYVKHLIEDAGGIEEVLVKYNSAISLVDREIGRIVEVLKKLDIFDNTLIVITSDHGESLSEHDIYFDHYGLYEECIHVPLLLAHPSFPKNKRVEGFIQHTDLTPTILDFLNIDTNIDFDGKSALPMIFDDNIKLHSHIYVEEAQVQRKYAIRNEKFKYIMSTSRADAICRYCGIIHGDIEELYDLENDPGEIKNIVKEKQDVANFLKDTLADWRKFQKSHKEENERVNTSNEEKEIMERLKKLGYF